MYVRNLLKTPLAITLLGCMALAALSCSGTPEPVNGFWSYKWGTPYDTILADSADLKYRLGGDRFQLTRNSVRMTFEDVQYGMGYNRVVLDFTPDGRLWHGNVRIPLVDESTIDSAVKTLHDRFGDETGTRKIEGDSGYITYWYTRSWLDRDFYSATVSPNIDPATIKRIDLLYGGCPTTCAIFTIRLLSNGTAYLWSVRGKEQLGGFRGQFDRDKFMMLADTAVTPGYLSLADVYEYRQIDLPTAGVRVDFGTFTQGSESLDGSGPPALEDFIAAIDSATYNIKWNRLVSWDTVRIFDQYHVDIDSLETIGEMQQP